MADTPTFAYTLVSASWIEDLEPELVDCYHGDILEWLMETEDQAIVPEALWGPEWQKAASRTAPVQLTRGFDPRPALLQVLGAPTFSTDRGRVLYFGAERVRTAGRASVGDETSRNTGPASHDQERFYEVLSDTIELACAEERGVLFIGGWGWTYDTDIPPEQSGVLRAAGMRHVDRHP